ncbi:MAG: hypothetical protein FJX76_27360, partial [Armatimonadetes bacterium]|nr:hypothetical protein [Armatimonadota bacterium]
LATNPPFEPPSPQPGVDPMMLPGPKPQILPGAFVTMDITTDRIASAVSIPEVALRRPPAPSEGQLPGVSLPYVWLAVPNSDGTYTVKKATVAAGASDGRRIVVNQGLSAGQYVVSSSFDMLRDGMKVTSVTPLLRPSEQSVFKVDITSSGYEPSTITVRKGEPTVIEFTRKTDATCGTEVVFPALGLKTALPLNQPRKVRFVPSKTGPISFTCGMNMLEGKVVVK